MVLCLAWLIYGETNDWNPQTLTVCITRLARLVAVRLKEFWSDFGAGTEIKPRKLRVNLLRMLDSSLHSSFTTRSFKLCEWSPFPTSPVTTVLNCGTGVIIRKSIVAARRVNKAEAHLIHPGPYSPKWTHWKITSWINELNSSSLWPVRTGDDNSTIQHNLFTLVAF